MLIFLSWASEIDQGRWDRTFRIHDVVSRLKTNNFVIIIAVFLKYLNVFTINHHNVFNILVDFVL